MTTAVYTFISKTIFDIINLESYQLPVTRKVLLCGTIERICLGWQAWVLAHPKYKLGSNFWLAQYTKFFIFQTQGYINHLIIHQQHFAEFPFITAANGSDQCEDIQKLEK